MSEYDAQSDAALATAIAVVGTAVRLPDAPDAASYWRNLREGVESVRRFSDEELRAAGVSPALLRNPHYVKAGVVLEGMEEFDAEFFGLSPRDAAIMDPQHRLLLECAWQLLEDAGHLPERFPGAIGVFAGCGMNAYFMFNLLTRPELLESVGLFLLRHTGNDKDFLSTRISYALDLRGPSVNVQTACSTSLVAIHAACQSLLSQECDLALAGGVTIELPHRRGYLYQEGEILSPDGRCYAFDARARGTIFGSGGGLVALRRLEDALADGDAIRAVILGSAVNNDGASKVGYLAPSVKGQVGAIAEALRVAGVSARSIGYVEAHGTGTAMGDPIEVAALTQAFAGSTPDRGFCALGSVKPNIGHLDTAAGVASFVKVVEALRHRELPPSLHFERANPNIDFAASAFYVNDVLRPWPAGREPRRAGVSSLGVGGTNAHLILEEAPAPPPAAPPARAAQLLVLCARSAASLDAASTRLAAALRAEPELKLADVAWTLQVGRRAFVHRRVLGASSAAEAAQLLESPDPRRVFSARAPADARAVAFLFPGGGAQYARMGAQLYEREPLFREQLERGFAVLRGQLDVDLRELLLAGTERAAEVDKQLERPAVQLPLIFMTSVALAVLWRSLGVEPRALLGHSMGENTAACVAGVLSFEDALGLVALRGRLFEQVEPGGMLSVALAAERLAPQLPAALELACVNAPELCVVSGPQAPLAELERGLREQGVEVARVPIAIAAHSRMLEPILPAFRDYLRSIKLREPQLPFVSNLTGQWISAEQATDPEYWVRHLRGTVRFADGLHRLAEDGAPILLEVGPGKALGSFARQLHGRETAAFSSLRHRDERVGDDVFLAAEFGRLWSAGAALSLERWHDGERRRRVSLPGYAFERRRHWIEPGAERRAEPASADGPPQRLPFADWFSEVQFERQPALALDAAALRAQPQRWLIFGEELGETLAQRLAELGQSAVRVVRGERFEQRGPALFAIDPREPEHYTALWRGLASGPGAPGQIAHCWSAGGAQRLELEELCARGFESLLLLARALTSEPPVGPLSLLVLSDGMHALGEEPGTPEKAALLGPVRVLPRELAGARCASLDLPADPAQHGALLDAVIAECAAGLPEPVLALRGGERWAQRCVPLALAAPEAVPLLREGGVVLLTGGLGGMALALCRALVERRGARVALLARRSLPPRAQWSRSLGGPAGAAVRALLELEERGAQLLVLEGDVADAASVRGALARVRERFGAVHGVIHAAGVLADGAIALKTLETARAVLRPKLQGTLELERALAGAELDFFALCSSTSAQLGLAGQVDYTAANAFLNAFARSRDRRPGAAARRTLALGWGVWAETGMAAEAAQRLGLIAAEQEPVPIAHPLLQRRLAAGPELFAYEAELRVEELWLLDEHRIRERGALLPGTGMIELLRAAAEASGLGLPLCIEDLIFIRPLWAPAGEVLRVRTELRRSGAGYEARVMRRIGADERGVELWCDHAQARLAAADAAAVPRVSLGELRERCAQGAERLGPGHRTRQERHLLFGARWRNLAACWRGQGEALVELELPRAYLRDLELYRAHPALLDMATGQGLELLPDYSDDAVLFVPMTYERIELRAPLSARLFSHVRGRPGASAQRDAVTFDFTLLDPSGAPLAEIRGFSMRRIAAQESLEEKGVPSHPLQLVPRAPARGGAGLELLELGVREGIRASEGGEALLRLLASACGPEPLISSLELERLARMAEPPAPRAPAAGPSGPASAAAAPLLDPVEAVVAGIWSELLGIEQVQRDDEFFSIGGHSLLGIRVVNRLNQQLQLSLSPAQLFEHPTVRQLAALLKELKPALAAAAPAQPAAAVSAASLLASSAPAAAAPRVAASAGPADPLADLTQVAACVRAEPPELLASHSGRPYALREHWLARRVLAPLFAIPRPRLRSLLQYLILKLEGGEWFSVTLRKLYARYYDLQIGPYTGSCFDIGQFKRGTRIGRYCSIFPSARIETANHPSNTISSNGVFYQPAAGFTRGYAIPRNRVEIGHDVHIGHNATILYPCARIGNGAIIGAGTLVDFDVPPYAIVAGSPATVVRFRFSKQKIAELQASRWWNATLEELEAAGQEFMRPVEGRTVR